MITIETRRESYEKLDRDTVTNRILSIMREKGTALTAKEIACDLHNDGLIPYPVRQAVAPRLTELANEGKVIAVRKEYDNETRRRVAAYRLVE